MTHFRAFLDQNVVIVFLLLLLLSFVCLFVCLSVCLYCDSTRLRVVSNFGDSDCGAGGNTHTRARNTWETRRDGSAKNEKSAVILALPWRRVASSRYSARACVYFRPPHDRYRQN